VEADVLKPRSFSRKGDRRLIGSIQIRVRYHFQNPHTDKEISYLKPLFPLSDESLDENVQHRIAEEIEKERSIDEGQTQPPDNLAPSDTNYSHVSSHGRGDLVQDEGYVDDVFHENLTKIMSQHIPVSRDQSLQSLYKKENYQRSSSSDNKSVTSLDSSSKGIHWLYNLITPSKMLPASASGKKYGFSQNDNEEHHDDSSSETASGTSSHHNEPASKHRKRKKAQQIIDGSAFGDKNFASQWMHETYDDIAISHPLVDKLIGMVVSKQTQAMLRAIIKTANSFVRTLLYTPSQISHLNLFFLGPRLSCYRG
jgi:hypothetical protein